MPFELNVYQVYQSTPDSDSKMSMPDYLFLPFLDAIKWLRNLWGWALHRFKYIPVGDNQLIIDFNTGI